MQHIIFLHGLLGDHQDFQKLENLLPHFRCHFIDLPFHGIAQNVFCDNFDEACEYLQQQIKNKVNNQSYILFGYSLGGRLALYFALQGFADKNLKGLILEGANVGLKTEEEKQARWDNDQKWATLFASQSIEKVLEQWYQQPVFSHLTQTQRAELIAKRKHNSGKNISQMLHATSLAKQPYLGEKLRQFSLPYLYLVGEQDQKFSAIAKKEQLCFQLIKQAGHNAHLENPIAFTKAIEKFLIQFK